MSRCKTEFYNGGTSLPGAGVCVATIRKIFVIGSNWVLLKSVRGEEGVVVMPSARVPVEIEYCVT